MTTWKETLNQAVEASEAENTKKLLAEQEKQAKLDKEAAAEGKLIIEQLLGITLPDADKPSWILDGYCFNFIQDRHDNYMFKTLFIQKSVPNSDFDFPIDEDFDYDYVYGYRTFTSTSISLNPMPSYLSENRVRLATALRELDEDVIRFEENNQQVVKRYLDSQSKAEPQHEPVAPKPRVEFKTYMIDPARMSNMFLPDLSEDVNEGWQIISTHYGQSSGVIDGELETDYTLIFVLQRTVYDAPTTPEPEKVAVTPEYANVTAPIAIETPIESPAGETEQPEEVVILNPQMTIIQPISPQLKELVKDKPHSQRILEIGYEAYLEELNAEVGEAIDARMTAIQNDPAYIALTTNRPLGQQLPTPLFSEN